MAVAKHDDNRVPTLIGVSTADGLTPINAEIDPVTGELLVKASTTNVLITKPFDYIGVTYPNTSTEVYTYKLGGSGGTEVGIVTVVYTDAVTKLILESVTVTHSA